MNIKKYWRAFKYVLDADPYQLEAIEIEAWNLREWPLAEADSKDGEDIVRSNRRQRGGRCLHERRGAGDRLNDRIDADIEGRRAGRS